MLVMGYSVLFVVPGDRSVLELILLLCPHRKASVVLMVSWLVVCEAMMMDLFGQHLLVE